jgi:branched-chain amino acid transport system substrate-binding protein
MTAMALSRRKVLGAAVAATTAATVPFHRARAAGQVIRLGVLTDLSGQYRDNSGPTTVLAAHQAVEDFNPGRHGFKVEIVSADHQQKPDLASGIARQWFDRDGVDAIFDMNNTAVALAVRSIAIEKDKAEIITGAASAELTGKYCSANQVHFTPDTWFFSHATGEAVMKLGGDSWFLIGPVARWWALCATRSRAPPISRPIWCPPRRRAPRCWACAGPAATWRTPSSRRMSSA